MSSILSNQQALEHAKQSLRSRDFAAARAALSDIVHREDEPLVAIEALMIAGLCAQHLGHREERIANYANALAIFADTFSNPRTWTASLSSTAYRLAIGAENGPAIKHLLQINYPDFPSAARECKASPLITNIQTWCEANAVPVTQLDPAEDIEIADTVGNKPVRYRAAQTWHTTIPDAEIVFGWDFVFTPAGEVLEGANYLPVSNSFAFMPHMYDPDLGLIAHVWSETCIPVDIDALFLSVPEKHHYGHWLADFLPRLRAWNRNEQKLIISSELPAKHRDLLSRFEVSAEHLVECELGQRYRFRSLRMVNAGKAVAPHPGTARFLYDHLGPRASTSEPRKILFLERDAGTRVPANMEQVQKVFSDFEVLTINPARMSLSDQEALLPEAKAVIGAFGTELYCLLNMRRGTTVIELSTDITHGGAYGALCTFLGLSHRLILCEKAPQRTRLRRKADRDLIVDCDVLRRCLEEVGRCP